MRISTEAHGMNPGAAAFDKAVPRIAFVTASLGRVTPIRHSENLLLVGADDISASAIPLLVRRLLLSPPVLSTRIKRLCLHQSKGSGYPAAPMCLRDGLNILEFYEFHKGRGAKDLVISCEYGKSRSVTTASFLALLLEGHAVVNPRMPNLWVKDVLHRALEVQAKTKTRGATQ